ADRSVDGFIAEIERRLDEIGIPRSLNEIGVPADCSGRIAEKACLDSAAGTNPRLASLAEIRALVDTAIARAR
ncbi:MAG: iron-containing alcohol dehydrogenase, partial [Rhodobacteraceae bacterium]|nr:iron-containing alcohol dehydrogenase [Paracoccaceae bacterium]